jgi:hypothetical protein
MADFCNWSSAVAVARTAFCHLRRKHVNDGELDDLTKAAAQNYRKWFAPGTTYKGCTVKFSGIAA